jgi:rhamnogalacturonyl hydrolase YesR
MEYARRGSGRGALAAAALLLAGCTGSAPGGASASGGAPGAGGAVMGTGGGAVGGAAGDSPEAGADAAVIDAPDAGAETRVPVVDRDATLALMRLVADYELGSFSATPNHNWVRAVFYTGVLALWRASGDGKYLDAAQSWGAANSWALGTDSSNDPRWADNEACVQTYADVYLQSPGAANDVMIASGRGVFDTMVAAPMAGRVEWWWCDALFMAPPAMARVAQATGNTQYVTLMETMWWDTKAFLYSDAQQLFWRDSTFLNTNTFWSRGNGWVVAGIARVLEALPAGDARRADYQALLAQMAARLKTLQASDGFWRSDLLNPDAYPNPESSGTALFNYGLAYGINAGILDRATYLDTVTRAFAALSGVVNAAGRLGWVQAVGKMPGPAQETDTNDYAAGAFLLAGNEMLKL